VDGANGPRRSTCRRTATLDKSRSPRTAPTAGRTRGTTGTPREVLDIDKDGRKDACFASDAGEIACYDAKTGNVKWSFHARDQGAYPGSIPVSPATSTSNGDGKYEVFFGARNAVYSDGSTSVRGNKDRRTMRIG